MFIPRTWCRVPWVGPMRLLYLPGQRKRLASRRPKPVHCQRPHGQNNLLAGPKRRTFYSYNAYLGGVCMRRLTPRSGRKMVASVGQGPLQRPLAILRLGPPTLPGPSHTSSLRLDDSLGPSCAESHFRSVAVRIMILPDSQLVHWFNHRSLAFAQLGAGSENAARFRQRRHAQPLRRAPHGKRAVTRELRMALVTQDGGCKASKARAHVIYPFLPWVPNSTIFVYPKEPKADRESLRFSRPLGTLPSAGPPKASRGRGRGGLACFGPGVGSRFQVSHGHRCLVAGSHLQGGGSPEMGAILLWQYLVACPGGSRTIFKYLDGSSLQPSGHRLFLYMYLYTYT